MAAFDNALAISIMTALTPCGAAGVPGASLAALGASAMKLKLTSTASTASASGTEITGSGYTAGGTAMPGASTTPAGTPPTTTLPHTAAISWTNGSGGNWSIVSAEITDSAAKRVWFGNFNGQPIVVANGNVFQVAADAITLGLS